MLYGDGWFYQKTLTYNPNEATEIANTLEGIIELYFPEGEPDANDLEVCKDVLLNGQIGIDEIVLGEEITNDFLIFTADPVPFDDEITIHLSHKDYTALGVVEIYTLTGQKISEEVLNWSESMDKVLNTSKLSSGVYVLKYTDLSYQKTIKIIK